MDIDLTNLPSDTEALQALVRVLAGDVKNKGLLIEQLKAQIAKLKRMQFGKSSEKIDRQIAQLELQLDELHEDEGHATATSLAVVQALIKETPEKPYRKPLPEHLPREEEVHEPSCTCPNCGGVMRKLGEDITEVLEYVPASFKVVKSRPTATPPETECMLLVVLAYRLFQRGHGWTRNATSSISIFRNAINALREF